MTDTGLTDGFYYLVGKMLSGLPNGLGAVLLFSVCRFGVCGCCCEPESTGFAYKTTVGGECVGPR